MDTLKTEVDYIRAYVKANLIHKIYFFGNDSVWVDVAELLKKSLKYGESNSGLLIGPRGCGKTTLIKEVLKSIQDEFNGHYLVIKLHGLVHTDDFLAVKAIATQMGLPTSVQGKIIGNFADNLTFLLNSLKAGDKYRSKALLFIIDEFDLFCGHNNQTLLYNLFDLSQSADCPICILGITCRIDIIELMEKRVKSRFSHRQFFLYPVLPLEGFPFLDYATQVISRHLRLPQQGWDCISKKKKEEWNRDLKILLEDKKFREVLQRIININNTEAVLRNILLNIVFNLRGNSKLTVELFKEQLDLLEKDDVIQALQDLSVLELCLLIAMKHHAEIYDNQPMNFEMILSRYIKFANANSNMQSFSRPVILKAFEHLQALEFIAPISTGGPKLQKEYQFFNLLVTSHQISECLKKYVELPTEIVHWANCSLA